MEMNRSAYHFYGYQQDNRTIEPDPFPGDGKKLEQLKILEAAPKPTLYSEGTRLTYYLRELYDKMTNVNIQYELNLHLKHPNSKIKSYKKYLDDLTSSLSCLKAHPQPINLKT